MNDLNITCYNMYNQLWLVTNSIEQWAPLLPKIDWILPDVSFYTPWLIYLYIFPVFSPTKISEIFLFPNINK